MKIEAIMPCYNECVRVPATDDQPAQLMGALHGSFCDKEFFRVQKALEVVPELVQHVVSMVSSSGQSDVRVSGSREAPLPFNGAAFNDANEVYQALVYFARVFADQMNVQPPGAAMRAWRNRTGVIMGLPADISPDGARYVVGTMATWLKINLEAISDQNPDDFMEFHDRMREVFQINARWPRTARPEFSQMPCPSEGCKGRVAVYPPHDFGDDQVVKCEKCGRVFPEGEYDFYWRLFKQVTAEEDPRKRHLLKKYGAA